MKWTYEELEKATKAVLDPAYKQAHEITDAAQAKVDAILEESGWTRWEWAEESFPGFGGAGPFIRESEKNASLLRKIIKGLHVIYKYDRNAQVYSSHDGIIVGSSAVFEKMSANDKHNLEELHGFVYEPNLKAWHIYV